MERKLGSCRRENLPFSKNGRPTPKNKNALLSGRKTAHSSQMQQAELVPHIHPFAAKKRGADSRSSDLHSGNRNFRVRLLPSHKGFVPLQWRAFAQKASASFGIGLVRTAPVEWFSRSLASGPIKTTSPDYCTSDGFYEVFSPRKTPRGSVLSYTKKGEIAMLLRKYSYITYR